jgi:signal transduction histidine kinase
VEARQQDSQIHVSIEDDGAGFDPRLEKGMGILGMEERVRQLGGAFRIDSAKGTWNQGFPIAAAGAGDHPRGLSEPDSHPDRR